MDHLRSVLSAEGTFTDRDFILGAGMGRRILQSIVDRGWAEETETGIPQHYRLTEAGRKALGESVSEDRS